MDLLANIARHALIERGFLPDFSPEALQETSVMNAPALLAGIRDMRELFWISIDNDDSLDLDQLTYAVKDRIYVAVADVDSLVPKGSALDTQAAHNTTSIYTPTQVFPMLPPRLSTDLTSLNYGADRNAMVIEIEIGNVGQFTLVDVYQARVNNHAKLAYHAVANWLSQKPEKIDPDLWNQLILQDEMAQKIKSDRIRQGALQFQTIEVIPTIKDGTVVGLKDQVHSRSEELIENFMIAANSCMTKFLEMKKLPVLKRVVRVPKRWDRIMNLAEEYGATLPDQPDVLALQQFLDQQQKASPTKFADLSLAVIKLVGKGEYILAKPAVHSPGHFDLALQDYAHTTAPNRRYPDLIMQRLAKSALTGTPFPYTDQELQSIAEHCTLKEDDAVKVERRVLKSAFAMVLEKQIGATFSAVVTGSNEKGVFVRLSDPPIEGKLTDGFKDLDVGDTLMVKLVHTNVEKGYIDFKRVL